MQILNRVVLACCVAATLACAQTQAPQPMPLWPNGAPGAQGTADIDIPTLTAYPASQNKVPTAVIVFPGAATCIFL